MTTAARARDTPGPPADNREVVAALYVDLEGIRARYECLRCKTVEGPVFGPDDVKPFVDTIRTAHLSRCTGENR
jgi:hypothetical protein